jgi:hypothetical protein
MAEIKYHFALEGNKIIPIDEVNKDERRAHTYTCMGCGAEMIAKIGEKKAPHFAHKANVENCNSETYLHKLTKRLIKEKFEAPGPFNIKYHRIGTCSKIKECLFGNKTECEVIQSNVFNLKDYYDTCQEEIQINGFVADLLLTNSMKPEREPVLIEVLVKHPCTEKKLKSGLRIIEIKVDSEDDIKALLQKDVLCESLDIVKNPELEDYIPNKGDAKFYNFDRSTQGEGERKIPRSILYDSGKSFVDRYSCHSIKKKKRSNSIFEVSFVPNDGEDFCYPYEYIGNIIASKNIPNFKTCILCKYYKSYMDMFMEDKTICCLYKKYNTPKEPQPKDARLCQYYSPEDTLLKDFKIQIPNYVIATE